jgi:hypothetical protein
MPKTKTEWGIAYTLAIIAISSWVYLAFAMSKGG